MPSPSQWNKIFVMSFPKNFQRYWHNLRKEYADSSVTFLSIGHIMQVCHNRWLEDNPDLLKSDSDGYKQEVDGDSNKTTSKADSDDGEKKRRFGNIKAYCSSGAFSKLRATSICHIHGGQKWGDCNLNPASSNYFPCDPNFQGSQCSQHQGCERGRGSGQPGSSQDSPGQVQQHHFGDGPGSGPEHYQFGTLLPMTSAPSQSQGSTMFERVYGYLPPYCPARHF